MKKYINGIHHLTNEEYHSSLGISRSMLMDMRKSTYHYWYKHLSGKAQKVEPTPAMNLGSAVHTLTLEEHRFDKEFYVLKTKTRPRRETKPYDEMIIQSEGKIILTHDEYLQAALMARSVKEDDRAKALFNGCKIEQSIYFNHSNTGIQCKVRPDARYTGDICDLKTTSDASPKAFQNSAVNYGYFLQSAMIYRALESINIEMKQFVFVVVEKEPPYPVAIYTLGDDALEYGLQQFDDLMFVLSQCQENDKWPGYPIREINLPSYVKFDTELEIE